MADQSTKMGKVLKMPRYQVIKNHILEQIASGAIKSKDKTESENELARRFNVSRLTVQRAVRDLVADGYLRRSQGAGTFVAERPTHFSLLEVRDLAEEARQRGKTPQTDVLMQRRIAPSDNVANAMELEPDDLVFHAIVLQRADAAPLAIEERFARTDVFADFLEQDFQSQSIYNYFAARSGLGEVETVLQAVVPETRYRTWLELGEGDPCLFLERRNRYEGRIVTLTRFTYAGPDFRLGSRYVPNL